MHLLCIEIDNHWLIALQNALLEVILVLYGEDLVQSGRGSEFACERPNGSAALQQISGSTQHFDQLIRLPNYLQDLQCLLQNF